MQQTTHVLVNDPESSLDSISNEHEQRKEESSYVNAFKISYVSSHVIKLL